MLIFVYTQTNTMTFQKQIELKNYLVSLQALSLKSAISDIVTRGDFGRFTDEEILYMVREIALNSSIKFKG